MPEMIYTAENLVDRGPPPFGFGLLTRADSYHHLINPCSEIIVSKETFLLSNICLIFPCYSAYIKEKEE
jgi:hypothetical protein